MVSSWMFAAGIVVALSSTAVAFAPLGLTPSSGFALRSASGIDFRGRSTAHACGPSMDLDWYKMEKGDDVAGGGAKYTFTIDVDAKIAADKYKTVMTEFKKTARFPGFRVGTIPPFMQTKVKQFVILECLEKTLGDAANDQNLELANAENKPTLDDAQVTRLTSEFKDGKPFTYTIMAELKPKSA